jgi:hypothetical protein
MYCGTPYIYVEEGPVQNELWHIVQITYTPSGCDSHSPQRSDFLNIRTLHIILVQYLCVALEI